MNLGEEWISTKEPKHTDTYSLIEVFDDGLDVVMFADQLDGTLGSDPSDRITIVAAKKDTEIYELEHSQPISSQNKIKK